MKVNERIKALRELMMERSIDVYIEPTSDPHQSEYVADYYKGRAYLTGFTGSAGIAVVTMNEAILWTDGRYFIQAENELSGSEIQLYKMNTKGYPAYDQWLMDNITKGARIGINGLIFSQGNYEILNEKLKKKSPVFHYHEDLVDIIWENRPALSKNPAFILDEKYSGKSTTEKLEEIREYLNKEEGDYLLIGSLDDIAWTFNIRGGDVTNNPVVISYTLIGKKDAKLFVDLDKLSVEVKAVLSTQGVECIPYEDVFKVLGDLEEGVSVILQKDRVNRLVYSSIPETVSIISQDNITTKLKGIKNTVEIQNQRIAYLKDGVALTKFFYWLDKNIGKLEIDEISAGEKLLKFRKEQEGFIEPSFGTISAYGSNGAMMHYSASLDKFSKLEDKGLYLIDSGGQYYNGTTDTTRTVALGEITDEEKEDFTLVLKGHINLISARFLMGTSGHALDVLARYPLWMKGVDYKSGTGHGIGHLLNVHEGPHRIATAVNSVALEEGMIVSIEPGVYKENKHGIRIENVVVVQEDIKTDSGEFLSFENLTLCHIDLNCIDPSMLNQHEKDWLNDYHREVYNKISPFLTEEEKEWLKEKTKEI